MPYTHHEKSHTNPNGDQVTSIYFGGTIKDKDIGRVTIFVEAGNSQLIKRLEKAVRRELNK